MLLQTNSYIVPRDKRAEHTRLVRRFRQTLQRLGCQHFEVYEQVGANWGSGESGGRCVHIMRFRDRKHQLAVQAAERNDPAAQALITEFCELINFPYQQQQGLFAVGFYQSVLPVASPRRGAGAADAGSPEAAAATGDDAAGQVAQDFAPEVDAEPAGKDLASDEAGQAQVASAPDDDDVTDRDNVSENDHDAPSDEPSERQNA